MSFEMRGNLPRDVIQRIIMSRIDAYQNCYGRQLVSKKDLNGTIKILIKIDGKGRTLVIRIHSDTMNNSAVQHCIITQIKRLKFPPPKDGKLVVIHYPFRLKMDVNR